MQTAWFLTQMVLAVASTTPELGTANDWSEHSFGTAASKAADLQAPFSFELGDQPSSALLPAWNLDRPAPAMRQDATVSTITWHDPATGLECRSEVTSYSDFPAVEWVLYFKNTANADSPILQNILALDAGLPLTRDKGARVHHAKGSECRLDDFSPLVTSLGPNAQDPQGAWVGESHPFRMESTGGRSSCGALPFFNVEMDGRGVMGAIGWTGDWVAEFYRTDSELRMRAGMRRTHLKLLPGEEIRSPRMLLLFYEGELLRGHNLLRQFILKYHTPTVDGKPAQPPICNATWGGNFASQHIAHGQWWHDQGLPLEYLWVDAGWFGADEAKAGATVFNSQWARFVGDWHANPGYFPEGLKPVGDALHAMGLKFLLWLEPERVFRDTPWTREHHEWLLGPIGDNSLFNLGNAEARNMLTDFLSQLITEAGLGCYRQDFNMDPRPFWEAADAPDRVGMSEIKHITGLYALWDALRQRHPGLLIDNCSSGGRRIDLETISRSIPLWRSDVQCWPGFGVTAMQGQTQGLGLWVPLSTGCCDREDTYAFRSALGPGMVIIMPDFENNIDAHFSVPWLQARMAELNAVRPFFHGDFYPLLSFSLSDDSWACWQFDRPDLGEGMVLALRRPASPFTAMQPRLQALAPDATYEFRDADTGEVLRFPGQVLRDKGLHIEVPQQPGSKLYTYKKLPNG